MNLRVTSNRETFKIETIVQECDQRGAERALQAAATDPADRATSVAIPPPPLL